MLTRSTLHALFIFALLTAGSFIGQALAQSPAPQQNPPASAPAQAVPPAQEIDKAQIEKRANSELGADIGATIAGWKKELDGLDEKLRQPLIRYSELSAIREELGAMRARVEDFDKHLTPWIDSAKALLAQLGPAPAPNQPAEPEQMTHNRAEQTYYLGVFLGAHNATDAARVRIDQLVNTIQDIRRRNFTSRLFEPVPRVYSSGTWSTAVSDLEDSLGRVRQLVWTWWKYQRDKDELRRLTLESLLIFGVLALGGILFIRRLRQKDELAITSWRKAAASAGLVLARALAGSIPVIFLYYSVSVAQPLPESIDWLFYNAARGWIVLVCVYALMATLFSPGRPEWRLIPASDHAAMRLYLLGLALALTYSLSTFLFIATRIVQAPFSLTIVISLPASFLVAGLVIAVLRTKLEANATAEAAEGGGSALSWLGLLRFPTWLIAISIILTAISGYLALSRFIAQQLVVTGTILAIVYLLLLSVDGLTQGFEDKSSMGGRWLDEIGLDERRRQQLSVPFSLFLKGLVLLFSVPLILLQWGYAWPDIVDWYQQLFFGFRIGNKEVSLAAVLASIIVFVLGYVAAKFFQSWLDQQILKPAGLSGGVRDSIRTTVGYAGVFAAALMALSYAGFSLSNLAIVAGAFSVGIGFGLQSVVSNFVSGLILLAERPIKVGDLVVVGGEEGYVRKISVRSTEVETFDRANVLIPNSYFITEKVKNWTLRNSHGRVAIPVKVAYGCNPRQVREILLKAAKDHLNVMTTPAPFVDFENFGEKGMEFKLYAFIHDLEKGTSTRTDLRIAILEAFEEAGISFSQNEVDVTLRDVAWLREMMNAYGKDAAQRANAGVRTLRAVHDDESR